MDRGELHASLDAEATLDAFAGVVCYRLVVRGEDLETTTTRQRVESAFDLVWLGIQPER